MTGNPRVAVVTGASRGIGRAIAERLGADGLHVVVNYLARKDAAEEVVATIERAGGAALVAQADVRDARQVRGLFDAAEERFGRVDVVVGNAGTARFSSVARTTDEDFEAMLADNTRSGFYLLRESANRVSDGGRVVMVTSGVTRTNGLGTGVYGASKAAVEQLVRVTAKEIAHRGITVNSVLPGATRTDALAAGVTEAGLARLVAATPLGRVGEPVDIADIVVFLTSHEGRWLTGQTISASGGAF
ncbi:SDR family oxidoreductase [Pseudonocardia spinosispora]|uniref:SDR family oxidoreductase n=1 Tax=Pseudonocardia spinosispora TaxID=103441 RepID=UPI00041C912E|nr:SDR family oxidoreductase [Pseudonocardia spinosispora]